MTNGFEFGRKMAEFGKAIGEAAYEPEAAKLKMAQSLRESELEEQEAERKRNDPFTMLKSLGSQIFRMKQEGADPAEIAAKQKAFDELGDVVRRIRTYNADVKREEESGMYHSTGPATEIVKPQAVLAGAEIMPYPGGVKGIVGEIGGFLGRESNWDEDTWETKQRAQFEAAIEKNVGDAYPPHVKRQIVDAAIRRQKRYGDIEALEDFEESIAVMMDQGFINRKGIKGKRLKGQVGPTLSEKLKKRSKKSKKKSQDQEALDWARNHPEDPRAKAILDHYGVSE